MSTQTVVLLVSFVLMGVVASIFLSAVRAASRPASAPPSEKARWRLIYLFLAVGVVVTVASLVPWPHAVAADGEPAAVVNVTGHQWYWEIDRETVPLGAPVLFNAHTADVTHGFGVMDAGGRLLLQAQAMPGYINQVEHVFTEPGTYQIVCLEYCGLAHHAMVWEFTVASAN